MSTFKVTAEKIQVTEHPNADALELAVIGGYRAVVVKGVYRTGDLVCYIPEAGVLPENLIKELGLEGKLAGSKKNRIKPVRLRGALSQGIVCKPSMLTEQELEEAYRNNLDLAEKLEITKYVPPVPTHMAGDVEGDASQVRWIDIENIKRYETIFNTGDEVVVTEKLHGTCMIVNIHVDENVRVTVSSKGLNAKHLVLKESEKNLYWQVAKLYNLQETGVKLAEKLGSIQVALFGEVFGPGVQDLHYGVEQNQRGYRIFDVAYVTSEGKTVFVDAKDLEGLLEGLVESVPVLYTGPYNRELIWEMAEGKDTLSQTHVREGVVVRSAEETECVTETYQGRKIAKFVSEAYLTRKGGTEYE